MDSFYNGFPPPGDVVTSGFCLFVDAEHALDLQFAEGIGVNTRNLLFVQPDAAEQALETVDTFVRSGTFDVIVVDSVYIPLPLCCLLF
jgi:recombination protein RecA